MNFFLLLKIIITLVTITFSKRLISYHCKNISIYGILILLFDKTYEMFGHIIYLIEDVYKLRVMTLKKSVIINFVTCNFCINFKIINKFNYLCH